MKAFYKPKTKNGSTLLHILGIFILFIAGWVVYSKINGYKILQIGTVKGTSIISPDLQESSLSAPAFININSAPANLAISTSPSNSETKDPDKEENSKPKISGVSDATGQVFYGTKAPNNKFGMYVNNNADDIKAAAKLVNSNGGRWGYVLLTMEISDKNKSSWQKLFDAASSSHLIPIIQLFNGSGKCDPNKMDFKELADTLGSLKWPSSKRYIAVFNEMNAKDYWCDRLAPNEYAIALNNAIKAFKAKSSSFFIMPGAFNSSARTQDRYLSEETYLTRMNQTIPGIFNRIDGWSTHSYPQPNFSGDINNLPAGYTARDTINNYTWEMEILQNYGAGDLPIFITETGWLHREGQNGCVQYSQGSLLSADTTAGRFKDAYLNYWLADPQIVAITPFIFKSSDPCAKGFAWQKPDGSWYPQATMLMNIAKTAGAQ